MHTENADARKLLVACHHALGHLSTGIVSGAAAERKPRCAFSTSFVALSVLSSLRPRGPRGETASPWTILGNDIARQYEFVDLVGPDTKTMFQVRCTVQMGTLGSLHHHIHFILAPAIAQQECYLVAILGTADQSVETGFFAVKVPYLDGGGNLIWPEDQEVTTKCLAVLHAGKPMNFLLLDKQRCLVKVPLLNDLSYRKVFAEIQEQVAGNLRGDVNVSSGPALVWDVTNAVAASKTARALAM